MSLLGSSRTADTTDTTANSFATINCPAGTDPAATSATDTLNLTSTGGTVTITGDATTDTINFESVGEIAFATIVPTAGTNVVAETAADTLTVTSADGSVAVTGTAASDTLDFAHIKYGMKASYTGQSTTTLELATGDYRVIDFNVATDDPFSMFTPGVTCRVTIPAAGGGDYVSEFQLTFNGTSIGFNAGDQMWTGFYLNGAIYAKSFHVHQVYSNGSYNVSVSSGLVQFPNLAAGDIVIPICRPITTSRTILDSTTFASTWSFWKIGK